MGETAKTGASQANYGATLKIIGLLFASTTSMIGSGWLFGAYHASKIAGPLSIWSWVVGAIITLLIALCFAELGVLFPRSGALVHMSHASHGDGLGRIWGWMLFLAYVPVPPVEAEAIVTYANNYLPFFLQQNSSGLLNLTGFFVCALLLGLFAALNLLAVRSLVALQLGGDLVETCGAGSGGDRAYRGRFALECLGRRSERLSVRQYFQRTARCRHCLQLSRLSRCDRSWRREF